ncbi:MAG: hypothetical protein FD189_1093 [Elusimicrobia bacterium]|nr:MAG: hypothetical protein FD189_1093 [Elusimicrobiota bacterium]
MKMPICKPMANRVLCRRLLTAWKSSGGVILPHYVPGELSQTIHSTDVREFPLAVIEALADRYYRERPSRGEDARRPGMGGIQTEYVPAWRDRRVRVGDVVVLSRYAGSDIEIIGGRIVPRIEDILARYDGPVEGIAATSKPLDAGSEVPAVSDEDTTDLGPDGEAASET